MYCELKSFIFLLFMSQKSFQGSVWYISVLPCYPQALFTFAINFVTIFHKILWKFDCCKACFDSKRIKYLWPRRQRSYFTRSDARFGHEVATLDTVGLVQVEFFQNFEAVNNAHFYARAFRWDNLCVVTYFEVIEQFVVILYDTSWSNLFQIKSWFSV